MEKSATAYVTLILGLAVLTLYLEAPAREQGPAAKKSLPRQALQRPAAAAASPRRLASQCQLPADQFHKYECKCVPNKMKETVCLEKCYGNYGASSTTSIIAQLKNWTVDLEEGEPQHPWRGHEAHLGAVVAPGGVPNPLPGFCELQHPTASSWFECNPGLDASKIITAIDGWCTFPGGDAASRLSQQINYTQLTVLNFAKYGVVFIDCDVVGPGMCNNRFHLEFTTMDQIDGAYPSVTFYAGEWTQATACKEATNGQTICALGAQSSAAAALNTAANGVCFVWEDQYAANFKYKDASAGTEFHLASGNCYENYATGESPEFGATGLGLFKELACHFKLADYDACFDGSAQCVISKKWCVSTDTNQDHLTYLSQSDDGFFPIAHIYSEALGAQVLFWNFEYSTKEVFGSDKSMACKTFTSFDVKKADPSGANWDLCPQCSGRVLCHWLEGYTTGASGGSFTKASPRASVEAKPGCWFEKDVANPLATLEPALIANKNAGCWKSVSVTSQEWLDSPAYSQVSSTEDAICKSDDATAAARLCSFSKYQTSLSLYMVEQGCMFTMKGIIQNCLAGNCEIGEGYCQTWKKAKSTAFTDADIVIAKYRNSASVAWNYLFGFYFNLYGVRDSASSVWQDLWWIAGISMQIEYNTYLAYYRNYLGQMPHRCHSFVGAGLCGFYAKSCGSALQLFTMGLTEDKLQIGDFCEPIDNNCWLEVTGHGFSVSGAADETQFKYCHPEGHLHAFGIGLFYLFLPCMSATNPIFHRQVSKAAIAMGNSRTNWVVNRILITSIEFFLGLFGVDWFHDNGCGATELAFLS